MNAVKQFSLFCFTLGTLGFANTVTLSPGSQVYVQANQDTQVVCTGNAPGAVLIICECVGSSNYSDLTANYYAQSTPLKSVVLERSIYTSDCQKKLTTHPICIK